MPPPTTYKDWKIATRLFRDDGKLTRYSIQFYRMRGDWYDEVRFDSHDKIHGSTVQSPHFHMKIGTDMKADEGQAIEEIKRIIDNYLQEIHGVIGT